MEISSFRSPKKISLWKWIGTLVSVILFAILLLEQEWSTILTLATNIPEVVILFLILGFLSVQALTALRWHLLLAQLEKKWNYYTTLKLVLAGNFASNFLPSTIGGDTLRITVLIRHTKNTSLAISSVIVDRLLNVISMFFYLPLGSVVFHTELQNLDIENILGSWVFFTKVQEQKLQIFKKITNLYNRIRRTWILQRKAVIKSFAIAIFANLLSMFCVWILAKNMGIVITFIQAISISAISYLVTLLPISINGYGIREMIYTVLYVSIGTSLEASTALAVLSRFFLVLSTVPGAFFFSQFFYGDTE